MQVLIIAGLDPVGGAGVIADLEALNLLGVKSGALVSALCAQNSQRVVRFNPVGPKILAEQFEMVLEESAPHWIKIGMLASVEQVELLAELLAPWRDRIVLDPVLSTSSGYDTLHPQALTALADKLLPLCRLVTPNLGEARRLLGREPNGGRSADALANELYERLGVPVLVKGGHLEGSKIDYLFDGQLTLFEPRLDQLKGHRGTGCRLASAITGHLAKGCPLAEAIRRAKQYIEMYLLSQLDKPHPPFRS